MSGLHELSTSEIAAGVKGKKFSALEVFDDCLNRTLACDGSLDALITTVVEDGRRAAEAIDGRVARGEPLGPLAGVPTVLKDNMCTYKVRTTAGSRILGGWEPPYSATVWTLLSEAGATLLGKSNMDEFAMGNTTGTSAFGPTRNPWDTSRVPGGSSGGSAAAVAAAYVPFALGSDTGGSIRQPASYCGIYGLKPTYGLVSRYGLIAYGSSLDQIGPFARSMADIALVMSVIARHDPRDSTSVPGKSFDFTVRKGSDALRGKRVALVREFQDFTLDKPIADAMKRVAKICEDAGAEITEVSLPTVGRYAVACYYAIAASEAHTNLARYDGVRYGAEADEHAGTLREAFEDVRSKGFGVEVKSRIIAGTCLTEPVRSEEYYVAATRVRTLIAEEFHRAFESADCILQPVTPSMPERIGEVDDDATKGYEADLYTLPVNMAGLPGLTFFTGYAESGLPVGLQLVGHRWSDATLVDMGAALEEIIGSPRVPAVVKGAA
ncbi:MAG: Asp-tRNA(Asn)/Glu-tRNA(Gln) amidotransferase subunit GatA [Synergistaceae bacterium]|jgi:aspartyl-tRNA(Asn)/glutamyl-tRNA(Gln) amidotransferase subunit A|nr:Asp-tRNA(Asn)/Glu-tRNA(Gln) amidotransferase subunit GatA [Synergistaceae bacterium]